MAASRMRAYRLDNDTLELLGTLAQQLGVSQTEVLRMSIRAMAEARVSLSIRIDDVKTEGRAAALTATGPLSAESRQIPPPVNTDVYTDVNTSIQPHIYVSTPGTPTGEEETGGPATGESTEGGSPEGGRVTEIDTVYTHFRTKVMPTARVCPVSKILARLKVFTVEELLQAVDNFAADEWCMSHNANRGAPWFFHSDARIEQYHLMQPRGPQPPSAPRRNGHAAPSKGADRPWDQWIIQVETQPDGNMIGRNARNPYYDPAARRPKGLPL